MPAVYVTDAVASAACGPRARQAWARHTHTIETAEDGAERVICGRVKLESMLQDACATDPDARPTCPTCAARDPRFGARK